MTETSQTIDPKRPWITDPRDAPASMKLLPTLLNPFGTASRVHFTRAWTVLFFARLFAILFPLGLMFVFGAAGANTEPLGALFILVPLTFMLTLIMSTILHMRRLADAGRQALLAFVVWLPVIVGLLVFLILVATQTPDLSGGGGGGWGRPQDPQALFQSWVSQQGNAAGFAYAATLIAVTVWSLVWVGRLPNGGGRTEDENGDIEDRPYREA